uniref:Uncharacterized protein n=1 Tax=Anguilla anguilla TaxID=7936 RepID=A0A0E9SZX0_ANGAN
MGFHGQAAVGLRSTCAIPSVCWSGIKHTAIGIWSCGNTVSGVMKIRFTIWQSDRLIWIWWNA